LITPSKYVIDALGSLTNEGLVPESPVDKLMLFLCSS